METSFLLEESEVLEAIFLDDLEVSKDDGGQIDSITLQLHPATGEEVDKQYVCMTLILKPPPTYPADPPEILIRNPRGIGEEELQSLLEDMKALADERRGESVLYELIQLGQEELTKGNVPHCLCMICLEHFHKMDEFTRTDCYHYFHQGCIARYVHHELNEKPEERKISFHVKEDGGKQLLCPVCRKEISPDTWEGYQLPPEEKVIVQLTPEILRLQEEMAALFEKQKRCGGIIDVEAERNKFLVTTEDFIALPSAADSSGEVQSTEGSVPASQTKTDSKERRADSRGANSGQSDRTREERHHARHSYYHHHHWERRGENAYYSRGKGREYHPDRRPDRRYRLHPSEGNHTRDKRVEEWRDAIDDIGGQEKGEKTNHCDDVRRRKHRHSDRQPGRARSGFGGRKEKQNSAKMSSKSPDQSTHHIKTDEVGGDEEVPTGSCDIAERDIKEKCGHRPGEEGKASDGKSCSQISADVLDIPKLRTSDQHHGKGRRRNVGDGPRWKERSCSGRGKDKYRVPRSPRDSGQYQPADDRDTDRTDTDPVRRPGDKNDKIPTQPTSVSAKGQDGFDQDTDPKVGEKDERQPNHHNRRNRGRRSGHRNSETFDEPCEQATAKHGSDKANHFHNSSNNDAGYLYNGSAGRGRGNRRKGLSGNTRGPERSAGKVEAPETFSGKTTDRSEDKGLDVNTSLLSTSVTPTNFSQQNPGKWHNKPDKKPRHGSSQQRPWGPVRENERYADSGGAPGFQTSKPPGISLGPREDAKPAHLRPPPGLKEINCMV